MNSSIAAGLMMDDFLNNLSVGEVLEAVNSKTCYELFPCIPQVWKNPLP